MEAFDLSYCTRLSCFVQERKLSSADIRLCGRLLEVLSQRVSRLHAKIRWENGVWVIEDAESLNGLIYQGRLADRHILAHGDRIHLAPTAVLRYEVMS